MSAFHEVRLPLALALGAVGGPQRRTEIVTLASGAEARNARWAHARRRYEVGGAIMTLDELHALAAFFEARRGRLHGFRFRDFADWRSGPPSVAPGPLDQPLAPAADGAFQLVKRYGDGAEAYLRPIRKPVAGSVRVARDGVELAPEDFVVDPTLGLVTFPAPPPPGAALSAGFAFDVPVRFDADNLDVSLDAFGAGRAPSVPLVEILI